MILKVIFLALIVLFIGYLFWESYYHKKLRKKIPLVIHVNGTRGKSTTTRLIDAGLRKAGYKVFTKTTGTKPMYINTNNEQKEVRRFGNANIIEQFKILRKAVKENADVLVIECMAISKDLIRITEDKMLHSNIAIITNVYNDHLDTMGESLEEVAKTLALVTPTNGSLIISNNQFEKLFNTYCTKKNSKLYISSKYEGENVFDTELENINNALMVAKLLEIDQEIFVDGMKSYQKDPGAYRVYKLGETRLYNGFSINDPDSTLMKYREIKEKLNDGELTLLLNTRNDRQYRTYQFIKLIGDLKPHKVFLTGSNFQYIIRKLKKFDIEVIKYRELNDLKEEKDVFLIGNFAGNGEKILKELSLLGELV